MSPVLDFLAGNCLLVLVALVLDSVIGDPVRLYRHVPHPVSALGALIAGLDRRLNRDRDGAVRRFAGGVAASLVAVAVAVAAALAVVWLAGRIDNGWFLEAIVASTLVSFRGLFEYARAVARGLEQDLDAGRDAVAHIVGRDPTRLDEAGVARAAIESVAENFSDGVVAPLFWLLIGGLPGIAAYKAVNTLDSMIGHRNARYEWFGKFAARTDDVANWVPARFAGLVIVAAALVTPGALAGRALHVMLRDAVHHRSVNAGWQEAAVAGALGIAIAGPREYADHSVDDPWMGDGRRDLKAEDVHRSLVLYVRAGALLAALAAAGFWLA